MSTSPVTSSIEFKIKRFPANEGAAVNNRKSRLAAKSVLRRATRRAKKALKGLSEQWTS